MGFKVFVDDNFHYRDETERYLHGEYDSYETAVAVCQEIVNGFLVDAYKPEMEAEELFKLFLAFGEDPFIQSPPPGKRFSAWEYAKRRCSEICHES